MSMGIGALGKKFLEDETEVIYSYISFNWDIDRLKEESHCPKDCNGYITIRKTDKIEPEIRQRVIRTASGKKKTVQRRVPTDVSVHELLKTGEVQIENCYDVWKTQNGYDVMAVLTCGKIIHEYQLSGEFPENVEWLS